MGESEDYLERISEKHFRGALGKILEYIPLKKKLKIFIFKASIIRFQLSLSRILQIHWVIWGLRNRWITLYIHVSVSGLYLLN